MKKIAIVAAACVAGLVVAKSLHLYSYASTFYTQVAAETKKQIPTKFELERLRQEISNLDHDVDRMIRPVAEYKAQIERMRREIAKSEVALDAQRQTLLDVTADLKNSPRTVRYGGRDFAAEDVRAKLQLDFASFKRVEANLQTQQKLLTAKETSLKASQEQLAKVISKKREYEVRLAQLEAEEETLQIARIGSKPAFDDSRATQIEEALTAIEDRHNAERAEFELRSNTVIPVHQRDRGPVDVESIRAYLEQGKDVAVNR